MGPSRNPKFENPIIPLRLLEGCTFGMNGTPSELSIKSSNLS
jgi:hypothetical protein